MASIIELLQKVQIIDDRAHDAVLSRAKSRSGGHLLQQIAELGLATESTVARAISVELGLPRIDLLMTPPEQAAIKLLDGRTCADRFLLPVALRENGDLLWLAMADPTDQDSLSIVRRKTQKRVRPAVAGPSEILRAIRQYYASPTLGTQQQPEEPPAEKLAAIEIADDSQEQVEIVNVMDEAASPLSRIASELGVSVPEDLPSRRGRQTPREIEMPPDAAADRRPPRVTRATPPRATPKIPPPTPAPPTRKSKRPPPAELPADLFPAAADTSIGREDLSQDDLALLDALRQSMEKGALVLRAVAELCVEKGVITREEMRAKRG